MTDKSDPLDTVMRRVETWDPLDLDQALAEVSHALFEVAADPVMLGRYVVLQRIGRGGSGVVYSGFDPELRRSVAIKMLRADDGGTSIRGMLQEAQAIARLSHPNVVTAYDVGEISPGHPQFRPGVFIVMEYVEGETLGAWAQREPRSWREIVETIVSVGRGLHAAHAAGLVHRDVKPGNVLVGTDGRPRLLDFGLACAPSEAAVDPSDVGLGTPATMAPEQHLGGPADPRTDLYGLCAALHMALHGCSPFEAADMAGLLRAKQTERPRRHRADVPRWLSEIIARGLAPEPAARFSDVDELVRALHRGLRRRQVWTIAATGAAVVVGVAAASWAWRTPSTLDACLVHGEQRIAEVWGEDARAAARAGFLEAGGAEARPVFDAVVGRVDALLGRWRDERDDMCTTAAQRDTDASPGREDFACLDGVLAEIEELRWLLEDADDEVVRGASRAVTQLTEPRECPRLATEPPRSGPLDGLLRRARLHDAAGKLESAAALASEALDQATLLADIGAQARAWTILCRTAIDRGLVEEQRHACDQAVVVAERAGNDELAAAGLLRWVRLAHGAGESRRWLEIAGARAQRLHTRAPWLRIELLDMQALVAKAEDRLEDALLSAEAALREGEKLYGADDSALVSSLDSAGRLQLQLGAFEAAAATYNRALTITQRAWGPRHPDVGGLLTNLGGVELARGRPATALVLVEQALAVKTENFGTDSPRLVTTLLRIARAAVAQGDLPRAEDAVGHALAIGQRAGDPARLAQSEVVAARVDVAASRWVPALASLSAAQSRFVAVDPEHEGLAELELLRGQCFVALGDGDDARGAFVEALTRLESIYGTDAGDLIEPLVEIAAWDQRHGRTGEAVAGLLRAQEIAQSVEGDLPVIRRVAEALTDPSTLERQPKRPVVELRLE